MNHLISIKKIAAIVAIAVVATGKLSAQSATAVSDSTVTALGGEPTVATQSAQEPKRFTRGIEQNVFVPKGQIVAGFSASFSQSKQDNYQFFIVEGINGNTGSMKITPWCVYMFQNNLGAGGRVAYTRSRTKMNSANVIFDTETSYDVDHLYSINQSLSTMAVLRAYLSLGNSRRFGIVADVQLEYAHGTSKMTDGQGIDFTGSYATTNSLNLGVSPGMVMFLNNYSAIEVNVGVLGLGFTKTHMLTNQVRIADMRSTKANFQVNLFSIMFGVSFYL